MKNILIGILGVISVLSLGYIVYDNFIKEEKVVYKEVYKECNCDKEELCENENTDNDDGHYVEYMLGVAKEESLHKYEVTNLYNGIVVIEDDDVKIEKKDSDLYCNGKKVGNGSADYLYETSNYIFVSHVAQNGEVFTNVIDKKGNVTSLENTELNEIQAENVYLREDDKLIVIGREFCGLECVYPTKKFALKINEDKLEIIKEK